jgi:hypothetical protein
MDICGWEYGCLVISNWEDVLLDISIHIVFSNTAFLGRYYSGQTWDWELTNKKFAISND